MEGPAGEARGARGFDLSHRFAEHIAPMVAASIDLVWSWDGAGRMAGKTAEKHGCYYPRRR
jgi:hypothetical protein